MYIFYATAPQRFLAWPSVETTASGSYLSILLGSEVGEKEYLIWEEEVERILPLDLESYLTPTTKFGDLGRACLSRSSCSQLLKERSEL